MSYHVHTFVTSVSRVEAVAMAMVVELQVTRPGESAAAVGGCASAFFSVSPLEIFKETSGDFPALFVADKTLTQCFYCDPNLSRL